MDKPVKGFMDDCKSSKECCSGFLCVYNKCLKKSALQDTGNKLRGNFAVDDAHDVLGSVVVDKVV